MARVFVNQKHILLVTITIRNCGVLVREKTTLVTAARLTTIRPTGQPGFRRRVDPLKSGCFSCHKQPLVFRHRDKGGGVA